jgi:small subunit ribosomal protein S9
MEKTTPHTTTNHTALNGERYIETIGRRKTSSVRVRITPATKTSYLFNDKELEAYFPTKELQSIATDAIATSKIAAKFKITAVLKGGGIHSQAEAFRHGVARALNVYDVQLRGVLKKAGFLKRDPRAKERRKFGLKKARKAPQWSKR